MRLREPAAWIMVAVTAASIVLAVVRFVLSLTTGSASLAVAAQDVALEAMGLTTLLALVALVIACVFHQPVGSARRLVGAAATVVTIGTVLTVIGALLGLPASAGTLAVVLEFLGGLLDVVLKVVAMATLWLIHRGMTAGRIEGASPPAPGAAETGAAGEPEASLPAPTWTPDAASGSVWTSASDAASGAQPTAYGVPGEGSGWRPVARPAADAIGPADSPPALDQGGPHDEGAPPGPRPASKWDLSTDSSDPA